MVLPETSLKVEPDAIPSIIGRAIFEEVIHKSCSYLSLWNNGLEPLIGCYTLQKQSQYILPEHEKKTESFLLA